jgi:hypothetical protein
MTEEDKKALAGEIADELRDSAYGIATEADRDRTALLVVDRVGQWLYQEGWMSPEAASQIHNRIAGWMTRTGSLPEHHVNPSILNSHLAELAAILHDR